VSGLKHNNDGDFMVRECNVKSENSGHSFFDWGSSVAYRTHLRCKELRERIWWFINMRWFAALICACIWLILLLDWVPVKMSSNQVLHSVLALIVLNILYSIIGRRILMRDLRERSRMIRNFIRAQIMGDFIILSYLSYYAGTIESPILMLFIPHIILASLFFTRIKSLIIALLAWVFAVAPLWFECQGWVPVVSIFNNSFKLAVISNHCWVGRVILLAVGISFLTIWYIVSEITTSLKLRENQLEDAYALLKNMDTEKTQATLRATHELKAPFAAIKSYVYTLQDGYCGSLPPKAEKVIGRIGERCDQLRDKISDIIHLSNIKTLVVSDVNFNPVSLNEVLVEEVAECDLLGRERNIQVKFEAYGPPAFISGSRAHLKTLFSNLIRNAVIYSWDNEVVFVGVRNDKGEVTVSVTDHGIGIPEDQFEKIFEEHFRSYEAVAHNPNGTGLGLPMVKELVRLHSGRLTLKSEIEKETTFNVIFKTVAPENKEESND